MVRPSSGVRLCLHRNAFRIQRSGKSERDHHISLRQFGFPLHPRERDACKDMSVVIGDLCLLNPSVHIWEGLKENRIKSLKQRKHIRMRIKKHYGIHISFSHAAPLPLSACFDLKLIIVFLSQRCQHPKRAYSFQTKRGRSKFRSRHNRQMQFRKPEACIVNISQIRCCMACFLCNFTIVFSLFWAIMRRTQKGVKKHVNC